MSATDSAGMSTRSLLELLLLAALWGGSFLLLRVASPAFGPIFLISARVAMGLTVILPVLLATGRLREFFRHWRIIALVSLTNMCLPFCLLAFASLSLGAGMISILNATVPFFAATSGLLLFGERLPAGAAGGLLLGFAGVVVLVAADGSQLGTGAMSAFAAGLVAALLYGLSTHLINRYLLGVSGLVITAGSLFFSTIYLSPAILWFWPVTVPGFGMWVNVFILGTACTGLAYVLFYRLITRVGSHRTLIVTYLVPVFSIGYGVVLLSEAVTPVMAIGALLVLLGVAITTSRLQVFPFRRQRAKTASDDRNP